MCQVLRQTLGIQWYLKPGLGPVPMELVVNHTNIQLQTMAMFDSNEGKEQRTQLSLRSCGRLL